MSDSPTFTSTVQSNAVASTDTSPTSIIRSRLADYVELTKTRIGVMVLVTVTVGYLLGSYGVWQPTVLLHTLFGVFLIASASSVLNQCIERNTDAKMARTANRPIPAGRISIMEAMTFSLWAISLGTIHLVLFVNTLTAVLTLATLLLYVGAYTPLKRYTSFCTAVGAIPGAAPPVIGWVASGQPLDWHAFALFAILFLWQFPHFLAIAWLYRHQYAQAGLRMLPSADPPKYVTGFLAVTYAIVLLPVSLIPHQLGLSGQVYFAVALLLGLAYLGYSLRFMFAESIPNARKLLFCSLIYLPLLLLTLTWNQLYILNTY